MSESTVNRRYFLKLVGLSAAALGAGVDCSTANRVSESATSQGIAQLPKERFAPVEVSSDRVIRTVVGLRPYRPSGFVVRPDELGGKTIVHNYGHGGAGVTLSWGSAVLAVEEALKTGATEIAVLGCGVIGLSTARLLQKKGFGVTIYTRDLPPRTTSNVAGALWFPVSVYDRATVGDPFLTQFARATRISHRMFQDFVGDRYGVWWIRNHFLYREPPGPPRFAGGNDLYPQIRMHRDEETYFGFPYVQQHHTMMIEPSIYLRALLRDFRMAGGRLEIREFGSPAEVVSLPEPVIMNCTGLGARELFGDEELIPVKGQLSILLPQPEIDYSYVAPLPNDLLYMFPRKDGIVLGGTTERNEWSLEPVPRESERILRGHASIADSLRS